MNRCLEQISLDWNILNTNASTNICLEHANTFRVIQTTECPIAVELYDW